MVYSIFRKTLRDQKSVCWGWGIGLTALSFYLAYIFPYIRNAAKVFDFLKKMPPFIQKLVDPRVFQSPEGFFNIQPFSVLAPLLFIGYAVFLGASALAGEEENGTLDLLLAQPISRRRVFLEKYLAGCVLLLIPAAIFLASMWGACLVFSISIHALRILEAFFSCFLLAMVFFSLTILLGALTGRRRTSSVTSAVIAVSSFLIFTYAGTVESLKPVQKYSPFYLYNGNTVILNGLKWSHAVDMFLLILLFSVAALLLFQHRDLRQ